MTSILTARNAAALLLAICVASISIYVRNSIACSVVFGWGFNQTQMREITAEDSQTDLGMRKAWAAMIEEGPVFKMVSSYADPNDQRLITAMAVDYGKAMESLARKLDDPSAFNFVTETRSTILSCSFTLKGSGELFSLIVDSMKLDGMVTVYLYRKHGHSRLSSRLISKDECYKLFSVAVSTNDEEVEAVAGEKDEDESDADEFTEGEGATIQVTMPLDSKGIRDEWLNPFLNGALAHEIQKVKSPKARSSVTAIILARLRADEMLLANSSSDYARAAWGKIALNAHFCLSLMPNGAKLIQEFQKIEDPVLKEILMVGLDSPAAKNARSQMTKDFCYAYFEIRPQQIGRPAEAEAR